MKIALMRSIGGTDFSEAGETDRFRITITADYMDGDIREFERRDIEVVLDFSASGPALAAAVRDAIKGAQPSGYNLQNKDVCLLQIQKGTLV